MRHAITPFLISNADLMMKLDDIWFNAFNSFGFIFHMFQCNLIKIVLAIYNCDFVPKLSSQFLKYIRKIANF